MPLGAELSEQQKKCLRLVHQGLTSKQIAPLLNTTPGTVDNYINTALAKLSMASRRDAARFLAEQESGIVQQLHLRSEAIASNGLDDGSKPSTEGRATIPRIFGLPPIGGRANDLRTSQRLAAIMRIAFFAALMLTATVAIIQGVIALLT